MTANSNNLFHVASPGCLLSQLEIFSVPATQLAIAETRSNYYRPISTLTNSQIIEFSLPSLSEYYYDLSTSLLYIKLKIVKSDGTALTAEESVNRVALTQNTLSSLFADADVYLNNRLISSSNGHYNYISYIETLLSYDQGAKNTYLTASGWTEKDLNDRSKKSKESKEVEFIGRLNCDIFKQNRLILTEVEIPIRLVRKSDSFVIDQAAESKLENLKINIIDAQFECKTVKTTNSVYLAHSKTLNSTNAKYPFRSVGLKTYPIIAKSNTAFIDNVFLSSIPIRMVMALVKDSSFHGTYAENGYHFNNHKLKSLTVKLNNSEVQPVIKTDYANSNFVKAYQSLFEGLGIYGKNLGNNITPVKFSESNCLYCFDLTNDLSSSDLSHANFNRSGVVNLELVFATAPDNNLVLVIYYEFQNCLEINSSRDILLQI